MPQHISVCILILGHLINYYSTPLYPLYSLTSSVSFQLISLFTLTFSFIQDLTSYVNCLFLCVNPKYCTVAVVNTISIVALEKMRLTNWLFLPSQGIQVIVNQCSQKKHKQTTDVCANNCILRLKNICNWEFLTPACRDKQLNRGPVRLYRGTSGGY